MRAVSTYGMVGVNAYAQVVSAAVFALSARAFGVASFGRQATVLSVAVTATAVLEFGVNARLVRDLAAGRLRQEEALSLSAGKTLATLAAASVPIAVVAVWVDAGWTTAVLALAYVAVLQHAQSLQAVLRGRKRLWAAVGLIGADKTIALLCLVIWWILLGLGPIGLWVSLIAGTGAECLLSLRLFGASALISAPYHPYRRVAAFGVVSVATGLQFLDVALAGMVTGAAQAGVYAAVSRWSAPLLLLPQSVAQLEAPRISGATSDEQAWRYLRRGGLLIAPTIIVAAAAIALAPWLVRVVLGSAYSNSVAPLRLLLLAVAAGAMGQILMNFLQGRCHERRAAQVIVAVVAIQFILIVLFGALAGATGVAAAMAMANAGISVGLYWTGRSVLSESRRIRRGGRPRAAHALR